MIEALSNYLSLNGFSNITKTDNEFSTDLIAEKDKKRKDCKELLRNKLGNNYLDILLKYFLRR